MLLAVGKAFSPQHPHVDLLPRYQFPLGVHYMSLILWRPSLWI